MVPKGRWYAPIDVQIFGEAAPRAVPVVGGARGDCASPVPGPFHAEDRAPARSIRLDDLSGVAAQRSHPQRWAIARRPPSDMPSDRPGAQSRQSLLSTQPCALMWRRDWLASSLPRAVFLFPVLLCPGRAVGMASDRIDAGPGPGARTARLIRLMLRMRPGPFSVARRGQLQNRAPARSR